jgi:hypothetical protein
MRSSSVSSGSSSDLIERLFASDTTEATAGLPRHQRIGTPSGADGKGTRGSTGGSPCAIHDIKRDPPPTFGMTKSCFRTLIKLAPTRQRGSLRECRVIGLPG